MQSVSDPDVLRQDALDKALIAAHASGDDEALVRLYTQAADSAQDSGDIDAMCFYLTHAYVFALSIGAPEANALNRRLTHHGRETPQPDLSAPE